MSAPDSIGPYEILGVIGQGGMGVVYRARHAATGKLVALKTVRVPEPELLSCIQREIDALAGVRHPGVVRILEDGIERGVPWCAMELLDGRTLRELMPAPEEHESTQLFVRAPAGDDTVRLADFPPGATTGEVQGRPFMWERIRPALGVVRDLCHALAYLHGEGIVHRDLKPENVLVRPSGRIVLIDFGLTQRLPADGSRESLRVIGEVLGTASYMSPEQIRGEILDARSDLYALGCLLFEAIAGFPPHRGASVAQILLGHLTAQASRLSHVVAGVPAELDDLVAGLLSRERRLRVGRASVVATVLERLGVAGGPPVDAPRARPYLYRPGLVGRSSERARLRHLLDPARSDRPFVVIRGASGVGKTRLAVEVASALRDGGHAVLGAACMPDAPPLAPLRPLLLALARHVAQHGVGGDDRLPRAALRLLARHEPALRELPEVSELTEPALEAADRRRLLLSTLAGICDVLSEAQPLLLLLDDLQWADDLTQGFLRALLERGGGAAISVLATARDEAGDAIAADPRIRLIDLGPLDRTAVEEMVAEMLASPVDDVLAEPLARHSGGNPFFVAELLATALHEGELVADEQGAIVVAAASGTLARMPTLGELMERRLRALPEGARVAAELASTLGGQATVSLLAGLMERAAGLDERACRDAVRALTWRHVVEEPFPGRLCFTHDKLRSAAYRSIARDALPRLHRHAAEAIEALALTAVRRCSDRSAATAGARRGAGTRVRCTSRPRARHGKQAFREAAELFAAHLGLGPADAASLGVRRELAIEALQPAGRTMDAIAELERVLEGAREIGDDALARATMESLGQLRWRTGEVERARCLLEDALLHHRAAGDRPGEGRSLRLLARLAYTEEKFDLAEELGRTALAIHQDAGDRGQVGLALAELAGARHARGAGPEAMDMYRQALAIFREVGDVRGEAMALGNLASLTWEAGNIDQADDYTEAALAAARRCGDRSLEGFLLGGLGAIAWSENDLDRAEGHFGKSLRIARESSDRRQEAMLLANLGSIAKDRGRWADARRLYAQSLHIHHDLGTRNDETAKMAALLQSLPSDDARQP
ncbi:MAG: tetratricopeptide repeat protein [Acidobacteriota bacterium]